MSPDSPRAAPPAPHPARSIIGVGTAGLRPSLWSRLPLRLIDRYLMKQFAISYLVCGSIIMALFVVLEGLSRLDNFLKQDAPLYQVLAGYLLATLPIYFTQNLGPILTLMAALFTVTLLNKGNEITPLRASGMSVQRVLAPFFLLAVLLAFTMVVVQEFMIPALRDQIRLGQSYGRSSSAIRPDAISDNHGNTISVRSYIPHEKLGRMVEVARCGPSGRIFELISARELVWDDSEGGYWQLKDALVRRYTEEGLVPEGEGDIERVEELSLHTDMKPIDLESSDKDIPYLTFNELRLQHGRRPHLKHLEVKIHRRFAFPMANVVLLLLGFPFVFRGFNRSVLIGIGTAIAIAAAYLLMDTVCADLGNKGDLPPILAAWLPVLFFGALGYTLFEGIER